MRPFPDVVRELAGGTVLDKATAGLAELVGAVMRTRKKGSITLTIEVSPNGEMSVTALAAVKVKAPESAVGGTIFFTKESADGTVELVRDDPRQERLNLRSVADRADEPVRTLEEVG